VRAMLVLAAAARDTIVKSKILRYSARATALATFAYIAVLGTPPATASSIYDIHYGIVGLLGSSSNIRRHSGDRWYPWRVAARGHP
jgi:hypothetical protein